MRRNFARQLFEMPARILYAILILGFTVSFSNCNPKESNTYVFRNNQPNDLVPANKYLVKKNQQNIINYIRRKGWDMKVTSTGLWYMVYKQGNGIKGEKGKSISLRYSLSLLNGTTCYSSDSLGLKTFRIGSGGVESGLEEAVLLLHQGDMARIIMPPHLAYGLLGDNNKIPPQSTILYEITVESIK